VLIIVRDDEVSDTTGDASSNAAGNQIFASQQVANIR